MSPLGEGADGMSVTEIAPEAANLHDEVAKISDKLDQARRLREGLAGILALPLDATNDQIFAAVHTRRTYVPPGDRVHDQIKALQEQYARLDAQYDRLVQALRAQGSLQ